MKRMWSRVRQYVRARRRVSSYDDLTRIGATPESRNLVQLSPRNFGSNINGAGGHL